MANLAHRIYEHWHSLPIRVRGAVIIAIPVTCLFTVLGAFAWLKSSLAEDEAWVQHTQTVRLETKQLLNALIDAETGVRGYGLTRQNEFLAPYYQAQAVIPESLTRLRRLVSDNPQQVAHLEDIQTLVNKNLAILQQKITLQQELRLLQEPTGRLVPTASLYEWLEEGRELMDETREAIDRFAQIEEELLTQRQQHQHQYRQITWIVLYASGALGTVGALLAVHLLFQLEQELMDREIALRSTNHRLEVACDQLQRFTANASHELRAPVAAVMANAQVGLMELDDPDEGLMLLRQRLNKIVALSKQMSSLVGELLFLARYEGSLASDALQPVDLTDLLWQLYADWLPQANANALQLTAHLPDHKVTVSADAILLRQAIANLLSNACRYTPAQGSIELQLQHQDQQALIQVKDSGVGIPPEALPHIFERFYRVDPQRSKASGGMGLGLAIVRHIIQVHGGQIKATSTVGQGTTFQIFLPLAAGSLG
jgi:signal transduction histidine kinase